ncbi:unnamed protein product, partial [Symbiodinium sp. CCMP2456]
SIALSLRSLIRHGTLTVLLAPHCTPPVQVLAPGSSVADVLFAVLFSRFLHGMEAFLRSACASPHIEVLQQGGEGAETPTWADDVVVLFQADRAEQVANLRHRGALMR